MNPERLESLLQQAQDLMRSDLNRVERALCNGTTEPLSEGAWLPHQAQSVQLSTGEVVNWICGRCGAELLKNDEGYWAAKPAPFPLP